VLSRALAEVSGRRTKELITDRQMLEALLSATLDDDDGGLGVIVGDDGKAGGGPR